MEHCGSYNPSVFICISFQEYGTVVDRGGTTQAERKAEWNRAAYSVQSAPGPKRSVATREELETLVIGMLERLNN